MSLIEYLKLQLEAGVDETLGDSPINRFAPPPPEQPLAENVQELMKAAQKKPAAPERASLTSPPPAAAIAEARALADKATTREELEQAVRDFNGCALKKLATNTVFSDGNPRANIMLIGEAPGAQEDIQGIPFCGASGQLLDKMLASADYDRNSVYISNTLFWRPPGNRQPSKEELAICQPFVEKHIALINPALLIFCGGTAVGSLLRKDIGITKLRGRMHEYSNQYMQKPIPVAVLFHPSYLLRSPGQKRLAWHDLLSIRHYMDSAKIPSPRP